MHGTDRDADEHFRSALAAALLAGALDNTIIVAPHIVSAAPDCLDTLAPGEVSWNCATWRTGGPSLDDDKLTTFDMMDEILRQLARKDIFPNLKMIVVTGHSAGGQFVNRYEMANRVHENLGVAVRYVVSNPSSYAWFDSTRPLPAPAACPQYDRWPYGFQRRFGYAARLSDQELRRQLASRPTTYLLGENDTLPVAGFDRSCSAMLQGSTRLERGRNFVRHVNEKLNSHQEVRIVPLCGHNPRCMLTSDTALPVLFPKL
jgi:hypothetical protein